VVHLVDFALPLPLFVASRLVSIAEVIAYSACLGLLIFDRRLRETGVAALAGVGAAALLNLHVFPPLAWHTIDGLLFAAAGLLAVERGLRSGRRGLVVGGAAAAGAAVVMKQSFFLAPVLVLARLAVAAARSPEGGLRSLGAPLAAMVAPGLVYVGFVAAAGAGDELWRQLSEAEPVYGRPLVDALFEPGQRGEMLPVLAAGAALLAAIHLGAGRRPAPPWRPILDLLGRTGISLLVLAVALGQDPLLGGLWSIQLFWLAVLTLVATSAATRRLDYPGVAVCALGWMASLSYGVPTPAFVGGSLALYVLARAWQGYEPPPEWRPRLVRRALTTAAVAGAVLMAVSFWDVRSSAVYLQTRDESVLSAGLGPVDDDLRGLRTDPATAQYLRDVKSCVDAHPARWTAILPEDGVSRLAFDLRSPFPLDWLWPPEYPDSGRQRLIDAARDLSRRDDWLVLFQTIPAGEVQGEVPPALPRAAASQKPPPFPFDPSLTPLISGPLRGERVACGSLVGIYRPALSG
jgi:hypothetical protein